MEGVYIAATYASYPASKHSGADSMAGGCSEGAAGCAGGASGGPGGRQMRGNCSRSSTEGGTGAVPREDLRSDERPLVVDADT